MDMHSGCVKRQESWFSTAKLGERCTKMHPLCIKTVLLRLIRFFWSMLLHSFIEWCDASDNSWPQLKMLWELFGQIHIGPINLFQQRRTVWLFELNWLCTGTPFHYIIVIVIVVSKKLWWILYLSPFFSDSVNVWNVLSESLCKPCLSYLWQKKDRVKKRKYFESFGEYLEIFTDAFGFTNKRTENRAEASWHGKAPWSLLLCGGRQH